MQRAIRKWRKSRQKLLLERALSRNLTITSDNLAFFQEINLIFNRIKKSGNTSLFIFFNDLAGGQEILPEQVARHKHQRSIYSTDLRRWPDLSTSRTFACVRNPYVRAVSGFLDKVGRGTIRSYRHYAGFGDPSVAGFENFLENLVDQDMRKVNRHFWPQKHLLLQPVEHFSYIARLESVSSDMQCFLRELGLDPSIASALQSPHQTKVANRYTNSATRKEFLSNRARTLVEKLHAVDFEAFHY